MKFYRNLKCNRRCNLNIILYHAITILKKITYNVNYSYLNPSGLFNNYERKCILALPIILLIIGFNKAYADGHKSQKGPKLEYFGTLSYADITRMNGYKRNFIADILVL